MYTTTATKLSLVFIGYNHISSCSSFGGWNYWKCESQWLEGYVNLMLALRLTLLYQSAVLNMVDHPLCNQTRQYCTHQYCARQYCTRQYCTHQYCTRQYCTRQYCTRQYCTHQYCTHKQTNKYSLCSCWCSVMHISIYFNCLLAIRNCIKQKSMYWVLPTPPFP